MLLWSVYADGGYVPARGRAECLSACGRLEHLDQVAGGILHQDLLAAGAGHDVVAERHAVRSEPVDLGVDVGDDEVDPVPPPGSGLLAVGHGTPGGALWARQQQTQVPSCDIGERWDRVGAQDETEVVRVELDRRRDIVDHVPNVHCLVNEHGASLVGMLGNEFADENSMTTQQTLPTSD
jgi:hypothetical protein